MITIQTKTFNFYRLMMGLLFAVVFFLPLKALSGFERVVIWGHKLHTHTHSYIHNAFYTAFKHLGYETYWLDNSDDVSGVDFSNALFITEGQVDAKIPLRADCQYILHNCDQTRYASVKAGNRIVLQVYTDRVLGFSNLVKVDTCIYYDLEGRCLYMPWATDLLPHEIEANKKRLSKKASSNKVYWIGTVGEGHFGNINQINPFIKACRENNIKFIQRGNVSVEEGIRLIQDSYLAPTILGRWQLEEGYIPCRIFKNISYGKMGLTNSPRVYELFERKIVYNQDTHQLFYDAVNRLNSMSRQELFDLMDFVKTKHTYLNRIQTLIDFLELVQESFE